MPAPPKWTFVLTALDGTILGELNNAADRTVTLPLNRVPTVSFKIPLWHPRAGNILSGDTMLKCYRTSGGTTRLVFVGLTISCEETADGQTQSLAANAVGPYWRVTKRLLGTTKAGWSYGITGSDAFGNPTGSTDLGTIAFAILNTINGAGYTGIKTGVLSPSTNGGVGPYFLKNAGEAIAELAGGINSFDYEVQPLEPQAPTVNGFPTIGQLNISNYIGVDRPDAVFEYGTSRSNVSSYNRSISRTDMINQALVPLQGWPDGVAATDDIVIRTDTTSISQHTLLQEAVNDAGVIDAGLRATIGDAHLAARAQQREIVTFTVATNATPAPFVDYNVGDAVRGRALVRGSLRFDAMFRIWGITFKIDQNGNESLDLQMVQE